MALLTTYYTSSTPPFPKRKTNSNNFCMYDPWIEPRHAKKKERGPLFRANPSFATSKSATFATSKNVIKLKKLYFGSRKQTPLRAWTGLVALQSAPTFLCFLPSVFLTEGRPAMGCVQGSKHAVSCAWKTERRSFTDNKSHERLLSVSV